eukprot:Pgem_evm1s14580
MFGWKSLLLRTVKPVNSGLICPRNAITGCRFVKTSSAKLDRAEGKSALLGQYGNVLG